MALPIEREDTAEYRIEPAHVGHTPGMLYLLEHSFPDSLLTALGPGFLREVLASYLTLPGGCGYVSLAPGSQEVVGLVVGCEDSRRHRQLLLARRGVPMLLHAARGLVGSPRAILSSLRFAVSLALRRLGVGQVHVVMEDAPIPPASLTFLAVCPRHRRRGIADRLTWEFLREMARRRVDQVKLAVAANNDSALSFYLSRRWRMAARVPTFDGRETYRLIHPSIPGTAKRGQP